MSVVCHGCKVDFGTRNAVFRHLRETHGACLDPKDYQDFVAYVQEQKKEKTVVLYGYLPRAGVLNNGQEAAQILLRVIKNTTDNSSEKINRSYGNVSRQDDAVAQDEMTGAITEVVSTRLPPLVVPVSEWIDHTNTQLQQYFDVLRQGSNNDTSTTTTTTTTTTATTRLPILRVLGRLAMPKSKFDAEMDLVRRRIECIIPADMLLGPHVQLEERMKYLQTPPTFTDETYLSKSNLHPCKPDRATLDYFIELKKIMQSLTTHIEKIDTNNQAQVMEKNFHQKKKYKIKHKKAFKHNDNNRSAREQADLELQSTTIVVEKLKNGAKNDENNTDGSNAKSNKGKNVLRRRRYHNFTPTVMAHDFLAYRRLDRFFHRATLRYNDPNVVAEHNNDVDTITTHTNRPFIVLSLSGDLFLSGQASRLIGLFIALARGEIDHDFIDCIFDENYPHLVPSVPFPSFPMYAAEASYASTEGKVKMILHPRRSDKLDAGWNDTDTLRRADDWESTLRELLVQQWYEGKVCEATGSFMIDKEWTENILQPWAVKAKEQLAEYRQWKTSQDSSNTNSDDKDTIIDNSIPSLDSVDPTVPELYAKVLHHLRVIDQSGQWPTTTLKRQLVMVSTSTEHTNGTSDNNNNNNNNTTTTTTSSLRLADSLSVARLQAKSNNKDYCASAYTFTQGQGGASGSFSVGAMPGCVQPKANTAFPELVKAAFELEVALGIPNRDSSSTIAINRNAQFRPHVDTGAGAGQSTSLIVGLGTYAGGELVVEGERVDIRYKPMSFDGWKQRHWTMPFQGERYSLVWFTPKGCEGVRGIDVCKDL